MLIGGIGLALIYAGLDQGNRLDWLNSGLVLSLLASGALLLIGFFVHEARTAHPLINVKVAFAPPLPKLLLMIGFLRLTILSTACARAGLGCSSPFANSASRRSAARGAVPAHRRARPHARQGA